jgi:hypothetical protein
MMKFSSKLIIDIPFLLMVNINYSINTPLTATMRSDLKSLFVLGVAQVVLPVKFVPQLLTLPRVNVPMV